MKTILLNLNKFLRYCLDHLSMAETRILVGIPVLLCVLCFAMPMFINSGKYSGQPIVDTFVILGCFFLGLSGIPIIFRKEAPGIVSSYGFLAVVQGIIMVLIGWGLIFLFLINGAHFL